MYIERWLCLLVSLPDEQIEMYENQLAGIVQTPFADFGLVGFDDDKNFRYVIIDPFGSE